MLVKKETQLDEITNLLKIISDKTRLIILLCLLDDDRCDIANCKNCHHERCLVEKCVSDIVNELGLSQSLISHQLKVLKNHHLLGYKKEGTTVYYYLIDRHVRLLVELALEHINEANKNLED